MVRLRSLWRPYFGRLATRCGLGKAMPIGLVAALAWACGGDERLPPQALPYLLQASVAPDGSTIPAGLDLDGSDDLIVTQAPVQRPARPFLQAVQIRRHTGETLGQTNFSGTILGIAPLDTERARGPQALVSFLRNDPLFVTALDEVVRRRRLQHRFAAMLHRWGTYAFWSGGALALVAAGFAIVHLHRRSRGLAELSRVALDNDVDGLLRLRADGRILWINRTLECWLGTGPPLAGAAVEALGTRAPQLASFCGRLLQTDPPRHIREDEPLPGGTGRHAAYLAEPLPSRRRRAAEWLVRVRDVTEARELQEARTWTILAQRVVHDLKNPLTSLLLTVQRMVMECQTRAPHLATALNPYAERMQQRIEQLRSMTTSFMKFVQADAPAQRVVPLNDFVLSEAEHIRRTLPADVHLVVRLCPESPLVAIDPQQFESVFENLVANAVNAMPNGGTIIFATGIDRGIRLLPAGTVADWAWLDVLDTGTGIPSDALERIFERGFTATESGSGLGLTIARHIVERHGGRIHAESEPGMGSAFSIHLPLGECRALSANGNGSSGTYANSHRNGNA